MKITKRTGASLALLTLAGLLAVACNDSSGDSCVGLCQRLVDCLDGGTSELQSACLDGCEYRLDAGLCTNATPAISCLTSLGCPDLVSVITAPSPAAQGCLASGGCDGGF